MDNFLLNDEYLLQLIEQQNLKRKTIIPFTIEEEKLMQMKMNTLKQLINDWILQMDLSYRHFKEHYENMTKTAIVFQETVCKLALMFLSQMSKIIGAGGLLDPNLMKVTKLGIDKILLLMKGERKREEYMEYCWRMHKIYSESSNQLKSSTFPGQLDELKTILDNKFSTASNWDGYRAILNTRFGEDIEMYNQVKNIIVKQGKMFLEGMFFSKTFYFLKQKNFGFGAAPSLECLGSMGILSWTVHKKSILNYFIDLLSDNDDGDIDFFWKGTAWTLCDKCLYSNKQWLKERYTPIPSKSVCHKLPNAWKGCTVYAVKANIVMRD